MTVPLTRPIAAPDNARDGDREKAPRWTMAALVAITALAALSYAWSITRDPLEPYYAAAVRSMAASWHNFAFGAFDPAGTITLDKLPGAFWVQALSVRLFGLHTWAIVLPQVLEGVAAVLVLYRAVRRLAGPVAGLIAALVLAVSPATVALNRGNISDSLMILLLVLAADALSVAVTTERMTPLLLAGLWVGLAFQAKMIEAWLVLPALGITYALAGPGSIARRLRGLVALGAVAGCVSLLWMTAVTLTPASDRPFIDGSQHNSVYSQVFVYNGFGRFGQQTPLQLLAGQSLGLTIPTAPPPSWKRLVSGPLGRDTGWLLPAALAAGGFGLISRRRQPRRDPVRAAIVLWGTWLVLFIVVFSVTSTINAYYTAASSPPVGALLGIGGVAAWAARDRPATRALVAAVVAGSTILAAALLPTSGTGLPGWLRPVAVGLGIVATVIVAVGILPSLRTRNGTEAVALAGLCGAAVAVLAVPAVASVSLVRNREGAFDTPFERAGAARDIDALFIGTPAMVKNDLPALQQVRLGARDLLATQTSAIASVFVYASGQEVLPIGGFTGTIPEPTLAQLRADVAGGQFHLVLAGHSHDPRIEWVESHCRAVGLATGALTNYFCLPADSR